MSVVGFLSRLAYVFDPSLVRFPNKIWEFPNFVYRNLSGQLSGTAVTMAVEQGCEGRHISFPLAERPTTVNAKIPSGDRPASFRHSARVENVGFELN